MRGAGKTYFRENHCFPKKGYRNMGVWRYMCTYILVQDYQNQRLYLTFLDHLMVGEGCPAAIHSSLTFSPSLTVSRLPAGRIDTLAGTAQKGSNILEKYLLHVILILLVKTGTHTVLIVRNFVRSSGRILDRMYIVHCTVWWCGTFGFVPFCRCFSNRGGRFRWTLAS